jgi:ERCC4-type nuclease
MNASSPGFVPATKSRLMVVRMGCSIIRQATIPKPVVLVDTREQLPWSLHARHPNWIGGEYRATLKTGDYSIQGMENVLTIERKGFNDLLVCMAGQRERFLQCCERLAEFRWKAIFIEATYEDLKTSYAWFGFPTELHPNSVCGTLDAIEAKFGIPIVYTSQCRELATERAASWLSKHFTYWWLEEHGFGRMLIDSDGL